VPTDDPPTGQDYEQTDFDDDTDVDVADFAKFQLCFNGPAQPLACD
jgi:hypothetical protein